MTDRSAQNGCPSQAPAVLRRRAGRLGWVALVLWPVGGWAASAPLAVQPLVQPQSGAPASGRLAPPSAQPAAMPGEAFGRWQPRVVHCQRSWAGLAVAECGTVFVDQRSAGVMRVSWPGRGGPGQTGVLTFVGTLAGSSEPMACAQAICSLRTSIELTISSVSQSLFDNRGIASTLPHAWPVTGRCQLNSTRIRCEAVAPSGESWTASAGLN